MWTFILLLFFLILYFPTAQKLKSKAQSLPHVYPSTSVCLSHGLGYLGDAVSPRITSPFYSLEILNPSCKNCQNLRKLDRFGEELATALHSWRYND